MAAPANPGSSPDEPHRDPGSPAGRWVPSPIDDGLYRHLEPGELRSELMRAAGVAEDAPAPDLIPQYRAPLRFDGTGAEYFRIWAVHLLLTLLTLGIYSAWAKVRKARWFAQHTVLLNDRFDYHGEPWRVLVGRVLALVLVLGWSWAFELSFWAGVGMLVVLCALGPALFASAQRFRLSNTSWRGLRFDHGVSLWRVYAVCVPLLLIWTSGTVAGAYMAYTSQQRDGPSVDMSGTWPLWLSMASLLAMPWAHSRLKQLQHGHARFGAWRFTFQPTAASFYGIYALGVAFFLGVGVLLILGAFTLQAVLGKKLFGLPVAILGTGSAFLLMWLLAWPYLAARTQQVVWHATRLDSRLRFESSIQGRRLQGIIVRQTLLTLFTLGIYWPFAAVAIARYRVECLSVVSESVPIQDTVAPARTQGERRATGDAAAEGFGLDLGW